MIISKDRFTIYFGNASDGIYKAKHDIAHATPLIQHEKFGPIAKKLGLAQLACLNQIHSASGMAINTIIPAFNYDGDYLITAQKNIGIGINTADCLPVVFYDKAGQVIALTHAGWKGSVASIVQKTICHMQKEFDTQRADLEIFFGPSAKVCCYTVNETFYSNIKALDSKSQSIIKKNDLFYFDLPYFNILQLHAMGIPNDAINVQYNLCTLCNIQFFSHRRQGELAGRQLSVVSLVE